MLDGLCRIIRSDTMAFTIIRVFFDGAFNNDRGKISRVVVSVLPPEIRDKVKIDGGFPDISVAILYLLFFDTG